MTNIVWVQSQTDLYAPHCFYNQGTKFLKQGLKILYDERTRLLLTEYSHCILIIHRNLLLNFRMILSSIIFRLPV